jgi:hypothetical protein
MIRIGQVPSAIHGCQVAKQAERSPLWDRRSANRCGTGIICSGSCQGGVVRSSDNKRAEAISPTRDLHRTESTDRQQPK